MNATVSTLDFSTILHAPETLHEMEVDGSYALYAPDFYGWPARKPNRVRALLGSFRDGASVGSVVAAALRDGREWAYIEELVNEISDLEEQGFLRARPAGLPYDRAAPPDALPRSVSVWLHVTNHCNLACSYCFVEGKTREIMSDATLKLTAERLANTARVTGLEAVTVKFAGGEPTLALPAIEAFRARLDAELAGGPTEAHYSILTNGTMLTPRLLHFLKMPRTSISISVDGYAEAHDIHRRTLVTLKPTWHKVSANVDALLDEGMRPYMMITITRETVRSLPQIVHWTLRRGLRMRIGVVRSFQPAEGSNSDADYCRSLIEAFDETFRMLEADESLRFDPRTIEICELGFDGPSQWLCCGLGVNHIVIRTDGTVTRCPMTVHEPGVEGDNLVEACREAASVLKVDAASPDPCLTCRWFPVCVGGCPVANERTTGTAKGPSPLCDFYRFVIPRFVEFFVRCEPKGEHQHGINCHSHEGG